MKTLGSESSTLPPSVVGRDALGKPRPRLDFFPRLSAFACLLSGAAALVGWSLNAPWLRGLPAGGFAMNPVTASAFLCAGISLALYGRARSRLPGLVCAAAVATAGLSRLLSAVGVVDFRVDGTLFVEALAASGGLDRSGMAPNTSMNLVLAGLALLALHVGGRRGRSLADVFALTSVALVSIPLIGYAYGLDALRHATWFMPTALNMAATLLVLDVGIVTARPWAGLVRVIADTTTGGLVARRLLPAAVAVPLALGFLRVHGQRAGLYDVQFGTILMVVSQVVLLAGVAWYTASRIAQIDRARSSAEAERVRLAAIVESSDDAMIGMTLLGIAVSWNTGAERLYGYRAEEVLGRSLTLLVAPEETDVASRTLGALGRGEAITQFERLHMRRDGTRVTVSLTLSPVRDEAGQVVSIAMTARDITERRRSEQQIAELNEHLRHHAEQVEAANKELEAFSYSVSHDLRAPLRHIDGFSDLLGRHAGASLDEKGRRYLETISGSAKSMGRLIDDLLDFSRIGRSEFRASAVDLSRLAEDVRRGMESDAGNRSVTWCIAPLPVVQGDPAMLRLVFTNLFSNALKYTGTRDAARIEVEAQASAGEDVIFVKDNGVGFDMAYAHKLFGVFQRLHGDGEFEGTGIGLANVRRIIHRHGGRTWAEGAPDAGATFYVSIPRAADARERKEGADERIEASVVG